MTTVSNNPFHDTTQCVFCLERIQGNIITTRFNCGCQITLHEECHVQLMEEGRLEYCWYCQRTMLNGVSHVQEQTQPDRNTERHTEHEPERESERESANQPPTENPMEYTNAMLIILYCMSLIPMISNLSNESDPLFVIMYISLLFYEFIVVTFMMRFILRHPCKKYYALRIILGWITPVQYIIFNCLKSYYLTQLVILLPIASQFYIVALNRIETTSTNQP